jgi:hypothetical protein
MVLAILIISILSLLISIVTLIFVWVYTVDRDATLDKINSYQRASLPMIHEKLDDLKNK